MSDIVCPIECVRTGCPEPDFIETNGAFLLSLIGIVGGGVGMLLTYFLKSRCRRIKCCGLECTRDVVALDPKDIQIQGTGTH